MLAFTSPANCRIASKVAHPLGSHVHADFLEDESDAASIECISTIYFPNAASVVGGYARPLGWVQTLLAKFRACLILPGTWYKEITSRPWRSKPPHTCRSTCCRGRRCVSHRFFPWSVPSLLDQCRCQKRSDVRNISPSAFPKTLSFGVGNLSRACKTAPGECDV